MNGLFRCHLITWIFNLLVCNHNITEKNKEGAVIPRTRGLIGLNNNGLFLASTK